MSEEMNNVYREYVKALGEISILESKLMRLRNKVVELENKMNSMNDEKRQKKEEIV